MGVKGIIIDVDDVLEFQGKVYPGAIETIDLLRTKGIVLRFLTNSTLKSWRSCAHRLRQAGFQVQDDEVITASYATAAYLSILKPRSCWVMLDGEGLEEFKDFEHDTQDPEYVVVGDYREKFDFRSLNHALRLLLRGAKLIGMQPGLIDMSSGEPELNVGSWVRMLERASGVEATIIGKPGSYAFQLTLETMGLGREEVLMVGDKVTTDVVGAQAFGMRVALVRAGEYDERDLVEGIRPDHVFDSVSEVVQVLEPGDL